MNFVPSWLHLFTNQHAHMRFFRTRQKPSKTQINAKKEKKTQKNLHKHEVSAPKTPVIPANVRKLIPEISILNFQFSIKLQPFEAQI